MQCLIQGKKQICGQLAIKGNEYALNGDYLEAVQCYSEAIKQWDSLFFPIEFGFFVNRALCYIKMDFFYLALLDINQATILNENNSKCYFIRSKVLKKLNEYELAEKDLQVAIKMSPDCEEIVEEIARIRENDKENYLFKEKLNQYDLHDKTYYKIKINFHLVQAQNLPTNLWNYNGIRVENLRRNSALDMIKAHFSLFGNIKDVKKIQSKVDNILVYYYNPVTPMFTIAYYQNRVVKELSVQENKTYKPLKLYFAPTDSQVDLKFSRPKHPINSSQECYYWRTTSCHLNERCPKLHMMANKNIDTQIWMKEKF